MKIAKLTSWTLDVPYKFPLLDEEPHSVLTLIEIETDDGIKGHATSAGDAAREIIGHGIAPKIVGMDPWDTEAVRSKLYWSMGTKTFTGAYSSAVGAIDIALWDIKGKSVNKPIYKLLGGARNTADAYVSMGLPQYSVDQLIELAKDYMSRGLKRFKILVGNPHDLGRRVEGLATDALVFEDAERIGALREAVGQEVEIMLDANFNYTYPQALRLAKLVEPYQITWLEDPVLKGDIRLMAHMRRETTVPIAGGSSVNDITHVPDLLERQAVDYLQPNVKSIGGFTVALKAAAFAEAYNINIEMGGASHQENAHLHMAVPNGGRVEFHLGPWAVGRQLFDNHPEPEGAQYHISERPGLGYTPKEGIVKEFGVD